MDPLKPAVQGSVWAFWVAAAGVAVGGIVPLALTGTSGRMVAVVIPYWIAALVLAGCGFLQAAGRSLTATLYFVAGLAIVYGMLAVLAVPLRLAVIGTCPVHGRCPAGLETPLTSAENSAIGFTVAAGLIAIGFGFFGLVTLYRRLSYVSGRPPTRRIPPVPSPGAAKPPELEPSPEAAAATTAPAAPVASATEDGEAAAEPLAELPAPESEDIPELPAHEPSSGEA